MPKEDEDMTTGEKLTALRRKKGLTQAQLAEILDVSRQSVSRWEQDVAFPETEKLIKLSRLLDCSIDFLLCNELQNKEVMTQPAAADCFNFIRECGCFFLATSIQDVPKLRPMGFIYADDKFLYIATDKRKQVYTDLIHNPQVEIASYNLNTRRWIRISGRVEVENSAMIKEAMTALYPLIRQDFINQDEIYFVMFRLQISRVYID